MNLKYWGIPDSRDISVCLLRFVCLTQLQPLANIPWVISIVADITLRNKKLTYNEAYGVFFTLLMKTPSNLRVVIKMNTVADITPKSTMF